MKDNMRKNKLKNFIDLINIFNMMIEEVVETEKFKEIDKFMQHGNTSCFWHSIAVAYYSFKVFEFFKINYNVQSLIKGAVLHDYFLYDWHENDNSHRLHGFRHPKVALKNATQDFKIDLIARDIIEKHMFPLTLKPPKYKESAMVCFIDKICSIYETFSSNAYAKLKCEKLKIK